MARDETAENEKWRLGGAYWNGLGGAYNPAARWQLKADTQTRTRTQTKNAVGGEAGAEAQSAEYNRPIIRKKTHHIPTKRAKMNV